MTANGLLQIGLYLAVLLACVKPLGLYMARVYSGSAPLLERLLGPVERLLYRVGGVDRDSEMTWRQYAAALLAFSFVSFLAVYALQRLQGFLPLNPEALAGRLARLVVQHGRQLRHEHELAGLRRRDHDELPDADARL